MRGLSNYYDYLSFVFRKEFCFFDGRNYVLEVMVSIGFNKYICVV